MSVGPRNRRRDVRRELPPLTIDLGDGPHQTRDWSLGGVAFRTSSQAAKSFDGEEEISGSFTIDSGHGGYRFTASVVRADQESGVVALRFVELAPDSFSVLERLLLRAQPVPGTAERPNLVPGHAAARPAQTGVSNWFTRWRSRLAP